jgi:hypothetical protein
LTYVLISVATIRALREEPLAEMGRVGGGGIGQAQGSTGLAGRKRTVEQRTRRRRKASRSSLRDVPRETAAEPRGNRRLGGAGTRARGQGER